MKTIGSILLAALLAPPLGAAARVTFAIDPGASRVIVHVGKAGLFSFAGHTHDVSAPVAEGTVDVDLADLSQSTVRVMFEAADVKVIADGEPAGDAPEVQRVMESARMLDVSRFPRITFVSRRIEVLGREGTQVQLRVAGDLTLHGVTKAESAGLAVTLAPDRLSATGVLRVKQTDFGIEPVTAGAGTVRVKDEVEIEFMLVALLRRAE